MEVDYYYYKCICQLHNNILLLYAVRIYQPSSHDGRMLYISPNVEQEVLTKQSRSRTIFY